MRKLTFILALVPVMAWGASDTIDEDGDYLNITCQTGKGRAEVYAGGGNGYGSGTVTLQYFSSASGAYENMCPTAADCQWTTGDSGAVPFDAGAPVTVQLNMNGSTSPTVPAAILCG
jgi:hypothetical protein